MGKLIYVTGGARSGKSTFAEQFARTYGDDVLYIATARAFDAEMTERIKKHQQSRPASWSTYEGILNIDKSITSNTGVALLDCITLLITNLMMDSNIDWDSASTEQIDTIERQIMEIIDNIIAATNDAKCDLIVVSNELGMGLVPAYPMGRIFRDIAGRVNQRLAFHAKEAYLIVSGIALKLK